MYLKVSIYRTCSATRFLAYGESFGGRASRHSAHRSSLFQQAVRNNNYLLIIKYLRKVSKYLYVLFITTQNLNLTTFCSSIRHVNINLIESRNSRFAHTINYLKRTLAIEMASCAAERRSGRAGAHAACERSHRARERAPRLLTTRAPSAAPQQLTNTRIIFSYILQHVSYSST